jgi:arylsulfatase A-like enzyme
MRRRDFLRAAAGAVPAVAAGLGREAAAGPFQEPMNIILFLSDQERAIQHFPPSWGGRHLPGMNQLLRNGLTFNNAFCNSCMCSPSRASLLTGYFPAQHNVKDTLTFGQQLSNTEVVLPTDLPNFASVLGAAGYEIAYKGKWHLSKPLTNPQTERSAHREWRSRDIVPYGFARWNPPDAGENQDLNQFGGGRANNDGRYFRDRGAVQAGDEGVFSYLQDVARRQQPFFLVVGTVNPHDVLSYPRTWRTGGYHGDSWLKGQIELPATLNEDLSTKPTAQRLFLLTLAAGLGPLTSDQERLNYLNFYGNLMRRIDDYLVRMLEILRQTGLLENTLIIRTSDHGEMGLTHGGARQKMFNFYEETLRVPLIYSNPRLFPEPRQSDAIVSHVDMLPTLATLVGAPESARADWEGVDYASLILDPNAPPVQDYTVFTFDDIRCGQNVTQLVPPPNRIISIRERRYKLAKYYDGDGNVPDQWEMYDLQTDPLEQNNLAWPGANPTPEQVAQRIRLTAKLEEVQATRLQPL